MSDLDKDIEPVTQSGWRAPLILLIVIFVITAFLIVLAPHCPMSIKTGSLVGMIIILAVFGLFIYWLLRRGQDYMAWAMTILAIILLFTGVTPGFQYLFA